MDVRKVGTARLYRARQSAVDGLHGALEGVAKWTPAADIPERELAQTWLGTSVVATVEVPIDPESSFRSFTDPVLYSRWLGGPVSIVDGRFSATLEWGTQVRGRYVLVVPPELIVMAWDFDDGNVPVPGRPLTAYLRIAPTDDGCLVRVDQLADTAEQADFLRAAWGLVLGRFALGAAAALDTATPLPARSARTKRHSPPS